MTEKEITERLKTLPYEAPADITWGTRPGGRIWPITASGAGGGNGMTMGRP